MNLGQAIIEAVESLYSNKLRSILTILGIVIGVGAVIAMLAIGAGAQSSITGSISGIGSNLLFVYKGNATTEVRNVKKITIEDANALLDQYQAPSVLAVAPIVSGSLEVTADGEKTSTTIDGVTVDYESVRNAKLSEGTFISEDNLLGRASVAILGSDVATKLFGRTDGLLGESIRINGQPFKVIGVLEAKGGSSFGSQDNIVLVPLTTAQVRLLHKDSSTVDILMVQATSASTVKQASDEVATILRQRHRTKAGEDDFTIFSQEDIAATAQTITGVLTIFLGGIAGISLLVGGIGIMNIMLASVMERIKEIGIRQAIGATKRDIVLQFLTEATMLSLSGGLVGIILGLALSKIIMELTDILTIVSPLSVIISFGVSASVGIIFGYMPSQRAAAQDPVESLRHE